MGISSISMPHVDEATETAKLTDTPHPSSLSYNTEPAFLNII